MTPRPPEEERVVTERSVRMELDALRARVARPGETTWFCKCGHPNIDHKKEIRVGNLTSWGCVAAGCNCERFTPDWEVEPTNIVSEYRRVEQDRDQFRVALERIASHDGERWDWTGYRWFSIAEGEGLKRQPSPQEIAQEALAAPVEGENA